MSEQNTVLNLAEYVQKLKAGQGHVAMNNIKHTDGLTAVISVYDQQKPSHMILEELYEWAENTENDAVVNKIEELEQDMSWNEQEEDE